METETQIPVSIDRGRTIFTFRDGHANFCDITDSGTHGVATSTTGDSVSIDFTKDIIGCREFKSHTSSTHQCTVSSFGKAAATASLDGSVQIWNTERPSQVWQRLVYRDYDRAVGVALSRDGNTLAACYQKRKEECGAIVLYNVPDFQKITWWKTKKLDIFSGSIAISDDGQILAHCSKSWAYAVDVQAAKNHKVNNTKSHKKWPVIGESHVALSGDGCVLVIADTRTLKVVNLSSDTIVELEGYQSSFRPFACISSSGNRVVAAVASNKFRIWDVRTGAIITDVVGYKTHTRGCAISQDGNILLSCSFDKTVSVTDISKAIEEAQYRNEDNFDEGYPEAKENQALVISNAEGVEINSKLFEDAQETVDVNRDVPRETSSSSRVQAIISQMEEMAKLEAEEMQFKNKNKASKAKSLPASENAENSDAVMNKEDSSENDAEGDSGNVADTDNENENIDTRRASPFSDPRDVFAKALESNNRASEGNLLHIQASEALEEVFLKEDLDKLDKYEKDDALLRADTERRYRINQREFVEATFIVMKAIRAAKTDRWTTAFICAAENLDNKLTVPQAATVISVVLSDDNLVYGNIVSTLENAIEEYDEVSYDNFMVAVKKLGYEN